MTVKISNPVIEITEVFYEYAGALWWSIDLPPRYIISTSSKNLRHQKIISRSEVADSAGMIFSMLLMLLPSLVAFVVYDWGDVSLVMIISFIWVGYYLVSWLISLGVKILNKVLYMKVIRSPNSLLLDAKRLNALAIDDEFRGTLWLFDQNPKLRSHWFVQKSTRSLTVPLPIKAIMVFENDVDLTLFRIAH